MNNIGIMAKFWLYKHINIIVLLTLLVTLLFYIYYRKKHINAIKKIEENFQVSSGEEYKSKYFDINYKYYETSKDEMPPSLTNPINQDEIILDIGGSYGEIDISKVPWDTENKELLPAETLWGVVPTYASVEFFKKIYLANKLQNLDSLPFSEDENAYHYEDPIFNYGTSDLSTGTGLQAASALTQIAVPMVTGYLAEKWGGAAKNIMQDVLSSAKNAPKSAAKGITSVFTKSTPVTKAKLTIFKKPKLSNVIDEAGQMFENPIKKGANKANSFIREGATKVRGNIFKRAANAVTKPVVNVFKRFLKTFVGKLVAKVAALIAKLIVISVVVTGTLLSLGPPGAILAGIYNMIVTPLLILLTLPDGPITKAMEKFADSEGCCPTGSVALNQAIPEGAEIIISMVPILGDIFDIFYPYLCADKSGMFILKGPYALPKYIEYSHLSSYYLPWPEYNCRGVTPKMQGKYIKSEIPTTKEYRDAYGALVGTLVVGVAGAAIALTGGAAGAGIIAGVGAGAGVAGGVAGGAAAGLGALNLINFPCPDTKRTTPWERSTDGMDIINVEYSWCYGPYSDLDQINANPSDFNQVNTKLVKFKKESITHELIENGQRFFYMDFSDPTALADMAQFYYNFAIKNPIPNDDDTLTLQYISKINYVIASSLYSCDVMCEMTNITYNIKDPSDCYEYTTFDHDRRFYYSVDRTKTAPSYWENQNNAVWKALDDRYDIMMYNIKEYMTRSAFKKIEAITPEVLITAYEVKQIAYDRYRLVGSNATSDDILTLSNNYLNAQSNYTDIIGDILKNSTSEPNYMQRFDYRLSTIIGIKAELYELQKQLRPVSDVNRNMQYSICGCTHLDDTAGAVTTPNVADNDEDSRKKVEFDVTPYLQRCTRNYVTLDRCIDLSNVEQIISQYEDKYPNKQIKTIHRIKAKGANACEYVWDEMIKGTSNINRVTNEVILQEDLSSCTFSLATQFYATQRYDNGQQIIQEPITGINMYNKPVVGSIQQQKNQYFNTPLAYRNATYYRPTIVTTTNITGFIESNIRYDELDTDYIPRYDPFTNSLLPDLVRPKKPIRIHYPNDPETYLGSDSNNKCSNPETLKRFILAYNTSNVNNPILSIINTYTSSSNTCDMEVDILNKYNNISNTIVRTTLTFNMVEGFQNNSNVQPYTYSSIKDRNGLGLNQQSDKNVAEPGFGYTKPYLDLVNPPIASNIIYFNNDLVTDFTASTKNILNDTNNLLLSLNTTQYLNNDISCRKKCDDPVIMQRMMEQYNNDNQARGRYQQDQNSMYTIFKTGTNSSSNCSMYFAQSEDTYEDLYMANPQNSNNYTTVNKPALTSINVKQLPGTCDFVPLINQNYMDISASDIALQSATEINANSIFTTQARIGGCKNLVCTNPDLYRAAIADYESVTGNTVTQLLGTMKITNDVCDYYIKQDMQFDNTYSEDVDTVLRVRYKYPIYMSNTTCGNFEYIPSTRFDPDTYTSDSFELQYLDNIDEDNLTDVSPLFDYISDPRDPIRNLVQTNISL